MTLPFGVFAAFVRTLRTVAFCLLFAVFPLSAKTLFVNAHATGTVQDGLSWSTAFTRIQSAVNAASAGDELWVAKGLYREAVSTAIPLGFYGGFTGSETTRDPRNWRANTTVIDGGRSRAVLTVSSSTTAVVVDGFTIRNAEPDLGVGVSGEGLKNYSLTVSNCLISDCGTGVSCGPSSTTVTDCTLLNNGTGIACGNYICVASSNVLAGNRIGVNAELISAQVFSNTFLNNVTALTGNGVFLDIANNIFAWNGTGVDPVYGGTKILRSNLVWQNRVDYAGATDPTGTNGNLRADPLLVSASVGEIHLTGASPCIGTGYVYTNIWTAKDIDGQARVQTQKPDIGADEFDGSARSVTPDVVRVKPNGSDEQDGSDWQKAKASIPAAVAALWGRGGEVWLKTGTYDGPACIPSAIVLTGGFAGTESALSERTGGLSVIDANGADYALAVRSSVEPARVDGVWLRGGWSGLDCAIGSPVVSNSVLAGNVEGASLAGSSPSLVNVTVAENNRGLVLSGASPTIVNTVVALNGTGVKADTASVPAFRNSCIGANDVDFDGTADPSGANGNLHANPGLVLPSHGDFHLQASSPCLDAGLDSVLPPAARDMDGQTRIQGAHLDIGVDEFTGTEPVTLRRIIRVAPDGDDANDGSSWDKPKASVQVAVDAVADGGEVWLASGTYPAGLRLKPFTHLIGGYARVTGLRDSGLASVLQGSPVVPGVSILGGHGSTTLDGLTVKGGAIGVRLDGASPLIAHNSLLHNGTAIEATDSSPTVEMNRISANFDGMRFDGGKALIRANTVSGNSDNAILSWNGSPDVRDNVLGGNGGFGLSVVDGSATAVNNTIIGNASALGAANAGPTVSNNIIAGNLKAVFRSGTTPDAVFSTNCFWDNLRGFDGLTDPSGTNGNIAVDPRLCSAAYGDIRLGQDSPCRDAGEPGAVAPGDIAYGGGDRVFNSRVDIGADESTGSAPVASPVVVRVNANTGDDANDGLTWATAKRTVQSALDAAALSGGEVWVASGDYIGGLTVYPFTYLYGGFRGSENARSERPGNPELTFLDGSGTLYGVQIRGGYTYTAIDGFTVSGARNGISCIDDASLLTDNLITANSIRGVSLVGGATRVSRNRVAGNSPAAQDYGICLEESTASITANVVLNNAPGSTTLGGGIGVTGGSPVISGNMVAGNGNGVFLFGAAGILANNTIVTNKTGVGFASLSAGGLTLANNIIASNTSRGIYNGSTSTLPVQLNNNVWGNPVDYYNVSNQTGKNGNISTDPRFRSAAFGNYRLNTGSPAIDAGNDTFVHVGDKEMDGKPRILGAHVDMGAWEHTASTRTLADGARALRIAGGLTSATASDIVTLDLSPSSPPDGRLNITDALLAFRNALGLDYQD